MSEDNQSSQLWRTDQVDENRVKAKKYLIFKLNECEYGVLLSDVKEVIGLPPCTTVPGSPKYFLGLINLRGRLVSAIDMKLKFGIPNLNKDVKRPAVVLADVGGITVGCVVDSVNEVLSLTKDQIENKLEVKISGQDDFINGIARFSNRPMILILDIKKAMDVSDLVSLRPAS